MITDTKEKILHLVEKRKQVSAKEIIDYLQISKQAVHKQLSGLIERKEITKIGKPPKVFYMLNKEEKECEVSSDFESFIKDRFIDITPIGQIEKGWKAFCSWCRKRKQDPVKKAKDYVNIIKKYDAIRKDGLLDGMRKIKTTFDNVFLDNIFYLDFYSIEHFGKTKIGKFLLYSKQSQNKKMIKELTTEVKPAVLGLIKKYKIDAVSFIPPTVKREVQFMKELERNLNLKQKKISITKIKTPILIPQKILNKIEDRIENAQYTFVIEEKTSYDNVLLIDDAVSSGATFNIVAQKMKEQGIAKKVICFSITGNLKGFDVISEV